MIKTLLASVVILPLLTGVAAARQPLSLNDAQMDQVTAGADGYILSNTGQLEFFNIPRGFIVDFITCPAGCTVVAFGDGFHHYPPGGMFSITEPLVGPPIIAPP
jgi:hypothetical protein